MEDEEGVQLRKMKKMKMVISRSPGQEGAR